MNKKIVLILLVLVLALCIIIGYSCRKRPQQTDPQATDGTVGTADPITGTAGESTGTQNPANATEPVFGESVGSGNDRRDDSAGSSSEQTQPSGNQTQSSESNVATNPGTTQPSNGESNDGVLSYEAYLKMSSGEQQAYFKSFEDPDKFYEWLEAAEAKHKAENPDNVITGDGTLDMGEIMDKINGKK